MEAELTSAEPIEGKNYAWTLWKAQMEVPGKLKEEKEVALIAFCGTRRLDESAEMRLTFCGWLQRTSMVRSSLWRRIGTFVDWARRAGVSRGSTSRSSRLSQVG